MNAIYVFAFFMDRKTRPLCVHKPIKDNVVELDITFK
jgi:hypothetical protein